jgi:hypothetical protein
LKERKKERKNLPFSQRKRIPFFFEKKKEPSTPFFSLKKKEGIGKLRFPTSP